MLIFHCEKGAHFSFWQSWIIVSSTRIDIVSLGLVHAPTEALCWGDLTPQKTKIARSLPVESLGFCFFFFADSPASTVLKCNYPWWYHLTLAVSSENSEVHSVESIGRGSERVPCEVPVRLTLALSDTQLWRCAYTVVWQSASPPVELAPWCWKQWRSEKKKLKSQYPGNAPHI